MPSKRRVANGPPPSHRQPQRPEDSHRDDARATTMRRTTKPAGDASLLEAARRALLHAAADAYEDAGIRGMCGEGRWEYALDAMRSLDLTAATATAAGAAATSATGSTSATTVARRRTPTATTASTTGRATTAVRAAKRAAAPASRSPHGAGSSTTDAGRGAQTGTAARASTDTHATTLQLKRAYDPASRTDGLRILVDRIWPRGLRRDAAAIDAWMPQVAPSNELRQWFGHVPARWSEFQKRYARELDRNPDAVRELAERLRGGRATLLFSARDVERNQAVALRAYLVRRRLVK